MALEDFVDPEVGIAVAATALVASPQARQVLRRGLVYGLAGIFKAGGAVSSAARDMAEGAQGAAAGGIVAEARKTAQGGRSRPSAGNA